MTQKIEAPKIPKENPAIAQDPSLPKALTNLENKQKLGGLKIEREKKLGDVGIAEFLQSTLEERLTSITNPPLLPAMLAQGTKCNFDFHENDVLERHISLADVMPENVREVTVVTRGKTLQGKRRGISGEFFSQQNQRLKIFTGTSTEILAIDNQQSKTVDPQKIDAFQPKNEEERHIIETALEKGVDPEFALALRRTEGGADDKAFGVLMNGIDNFELQLKMAIKLIGRYEGDFASKYPDTPIRDEQGRYTPEFLAYFSNRYSPIGAANDPTNLNQNHLINLANIYSQNNPDFLAKGKEFLAAQQRARARHIGNGERWSDRDILRTDRHNNPTAIKAYPQFLDTLTSIGLQEGIDFWEGDDTEGIDSDPVPTIAFKDIETGMKGNIAVIDKIGFYTASGRQRWDHTAYRPEEWNGMNTGQKEAVIWQMYRREGGNGDFMPLNPPKSIEDKENNELIELKKNVFGKTEEAVKAQLVNVTLFSHQVEVHGLIADRIRRVNSIVRDWTPQEEDGVQCFKWRNIRGYEDRGDSYLSNHSFGIAFDIDPNHNALGQDGTTLPRRVIDAFKAEGFGWGGDWGRRPDPMHFELAEDEVRKLAQEKGVA